MTQKQQPRRDGAAPPPPSPNQHFSTPPPERPIGTGGVSPPQLPPAPSPPPPPPPTNLQAKSLGGSDAPSAGQASKGQAAPRKRGELNKIDNSASRAIKELDKRYQYLADLTQHSQTHLRKEFQEHAQQERKRLLQEMPIEQLKDFADKVRTGLLIRAGIDMATLLAMNAEGFALIPGVGPVTAASLRAAVAGARLWASKQEISLPRPDQLRREHSGLLTAVAKELRARAVPVGLVPELEHALDILETEVKDLRRLRSPARHLIGRGGSPEEIAALAGSIEAQVDSAAFDHLRERADLAIHNCRVPRKFDDLTKEYSQRFADYGSILDQLITELGGTNEARVERARGGLPTQVAARIERTKLRLAGLSVHLRGYQQFGAQFMLTQKRAILGDEMGLGKTIQALAALTHVVNSERAPRLLIVAPASLLANWEHEILQRTDFEVHLLQGDSREREMARWLKSGGLAIVSFSTLIRMRRLDEIAVDYLVVDEAHYIKNPASKRSIAVENLAKHATRLVLMTGTPMENRVEEFQNLVRVTNPPLYYEAVGRVSGSKIAFRDSVAPLYLRRNQEDVLRELPERLELEEWVQLGGNEHAAHHTELVRGNMMGMRQAAIFGGGIESAKLQRLREILDYYRGDGQKVLVFSYFLDALDYVQQLEPGAYRLDGRLDADGKLGAVQRFSKHDGFAVLASQITAGGVGLNIQAASAVVLLEPQLKPSTEWQAIARAHRMGQTRRVTVHRLLARACVDESLYALVGRKTQLFDDYARESTLKSATRASTEQESSGLVEQILGIEHERASRSAAA